MPNNDLSLREAGAKISSSGLADDVRQPTERGASQQRQSSKDTRRDAETRQARKSAREERDEVQDEPADEFDDEALDDDDAEGSNRESGDTEDGDDDSDEDSQSDDGESDDEGEDADEDERPAKEAKHTVKVNGKTFEVSTSELVAGYQRNADYQQKTRQVAERNRALTASHTQVAGDYAKRLSQVNSIFQGVQRLLIGDMNSAQMRQLMAEDPTQYLLQKQLHQDRIDRVNTVIQGLATEHERHFGEFTEAQKANAVELARQARDEVIREIPDWDGEGKKRLAAYLTTTGKFSMAELNEVRDARMLLVADKARKWDAYQAAKRRDAKPKPKPAPKHVKPGKTSITRAAEHNQTRGQVFRKAKDRARKSGDMRDAGRAIAHLLK